MRVQSAFEVLLKQVAHELGTEDPNIVDRCNTPPNVTVDERAPLDRTTPDLGVRMENTRIVIPKVSDALVDPLIAKLALDWLFSPYLRHLPDPAHQISFLTPWFLLKKAGKWLTPWEQLWAEVFPSPIHHGGWEFSREWLIRAAEDDDILLLFDFHDCVKALADNGPHSTLTQISTDVFLDAFYAQALSVRTLNDTEKTIIARAIDLNCADAQRLGVELHLPRSTAYHVVKHCFKKLRLGERGYLKQYCLGLEPILLFFLHMREEDAALVDQYFRAIPYFYNEARLIPPGKEQSGQDDLTLLISLWFPGLFAHKLMTRVKRFTATHGFPGIHWFRYDQFHHGYALRRFGIDVETYRAFNLRGDVVANRVALQPGDLAILGQWLLTRPARPLREVARATGFSIKRAFAAKKRLLSELIAGKDVSVLLDHFLSVREFRLLLRAPTPDEVAYFRTAFPEHYCFCDVNDQELHVLLLVPDGQTRDLEAFVAERANRVVLAGFNRGPLYSHLFNLADLEAEYDYATNEWKDPFRAPERWHWLC